MPTAFWSQLDQEIRNTIIKELDGGASLSILADKYSLHRESLARRYREIKQRRSFGIKESSKKIIEIEQSNKNDDYIAVLPETNILQSAIFPKLSYKVVGAVESLPSDRYMYVETKQQVTILFVTDSHFGQHDQQACNTFIKVAEKIPHDLIIHGGDALECYGLSRYGKDPNQIFRSSLKAERKYWKEFNIKLNDVTDKPKFIIAGNHIDRYFEWQKINPAVMALDEFQLDNVLELSNLGYAPMVNSIYFDASAEADYPDPKLLFHHGSVSRRHSGASSRAESENRGYVNSISGHVHRLSVAYRRTMSGQVLSAEGGTLRTLQPEWMSFPDWQHGCLVVSYDPSISYVGASPILFINGQAYINGQRI